MYNNIKVSIITPNYNGARFIEYSIQSVINQTYKDWELIIVDDCSADNSVKIIENYKDIRIKTLKNRQNMGAAESRNNGIRHASGEIIAFLDSDDIWKQNKLEEQIKWYKKYNAAIVFSNYDLIDEQGNHLNKVITAPRTLTYEDLLKSNHIGCLTGSYNVKLLGKRYFIRHGHEDYILWLSILKEGYKAVNINQCLASRRVLRESLSSNKFRAIKWQWNIYRNIERLSICKSLYYFVFYGYYALKKHLV
jgi:glycosyltransferase involved in cell wall biosynthesis